MWPAIRLAFGCWVCNAKRRFAGQTIKVFALMLLPSPLLSYWHYSIHSAHPCSFWLHRESLVLYWESKWCQHCGRREAQSSQKGCGYCISASCKLIPHGAGSLLWLWLSVTAWALEEDEMEGYSTCSEALVTIDVMAASVLHITKLTSIVLNLIPKN